MTSTNTITKKENLQKFSWKEFFILAAAGLFGAVASLPTAWSTIAETAAKANIPIQLLLGGQIVQSVIWMFLAFGIGLLLSTITGLGASILEGYLNEEAVGAKLRSHILPLLSV